MIRRVGSKFLRVVAGITIAFLLLLAVFIWRLAEDPIPLNLLTPYIESVLPPSLNGMQVDVQDIVLAWHRQAKRIVLSARNIHLRDAQGMVDATLPTVDVTLNLQLLLQRRAVALNNVYIADAQFHLQASADGTPPFRLERLMPTPQGVFRALDAMIAALQSRPLFADLNAIHVVNSAVTVYNTPLIRPLHLSELILSLGQTATSISSKLSLVTSLSDTDLEFDLSTLYERPARRLSLKSEFVNFRPSDFAVLAPMLSELSDLDIPFSGSLQAALNPQDTWPAVNVDIQGGAGQVTISDFYRQPLQVQSFRARGHLNNTNETLRIETATLDLGASKHNSPRLHLQSTMTGLNHPTRIEGDVTLTAFTMDDLEQYWPPGVSQGPRQWITQNIPKGLLHQTKAHMVLGSSKTNQQALMVQDITGSLQYEGVELHYLRPLPPIHNITGKGHFNRSGLHFQVADGDLANMPLRDGQVDITGLDRSHRAIAIRTKIAGTLQEALPLLNHPRLNLIAGLRMPLEAVTGRFDVEPKIAFALRKSLRIADIDIQVQGMLQDVSLQAAVLNQDLANSQLRIDLDRQRMTLEGHAEWATIPLSFTWDTRFKPQHPSDWRDQVHVEIPRIGHAGRTRLGFDLPGMIEGPMAADIDIRSGWNQQQTVDSHIDLRETTLNLPWLNWHKPANEPAEVTGKLLRTANREMALTDFRLETKTLQARGSAQFDAATLVRADLSHVAFGASDFRDMEIQSLNPGLAITIGDGFLDAAPLRQLLANPSATPKTDRTQPTNAFPLQLHLPHLHRVQIAPGRFLRNVRAYLEWNGVDWNAITASGRIPTELMQQRDGQSSNTDNALNTFAFHYLPNAQQQPNLFLQTNDLGAVLHALNLYDNLIGGDITLIGHTNGDGDGDEDGDGDGIQTQVQATQFTVQQAPVIAHILAAASLHGLTNLLNNDGLKLDNLEAELTLYGDRLSITRSHAHGGSLGVTAHGDIAYQTGELDLQGTIIPAYLVNSILGQVPVVNLLVGGKGQGLVAVNYALTEQITKPKISINPISALTPGFLRGIFGLFQPYEEGDVQPSLPELSPEQEPQINEP